MEASRVRNGIVEYYNQHISPKLDGKSCFVGGMVIGTAVGALACLAVNIIQKKYIKKTNTKGE